jgi:DNA-binding transcriptional LysR family regulator
MELRHLRYFVAVAEALSFTRAAENLHHSVPQCKQPRFGRPRVARQLLTACAQSVQSVQRLSRGRAEQLNIGYVANIYHDLLPATLGAFRKACPRTALNLFDITPAEQYQALEGRKIDLGFVPFHHAAAICKRQALAKTS